MVPREEWGTVAILVFFVAITLLSAALIVSGMGRRTSRATWCENQGWASQQIGPTTVCVDDQGFLRVRP